MGIYSDSKRFCDPDTGEELEVNMDELMEQFFYDEHYADSDEEKRALIESADAVFLEKSNISSRKTMVRLNKNDDITRRTTMAALQIAKDNNDTLWKALVKNRVQERKLLRAIKKKYNSKANQIARIGQKKYLKNANQSKMLKKSDISHRD